MASKRPKRIIKPLSWMPFFIDDFYASPKVQAMGLVGEAIYVRLIARQWKEGSIPADLRILARSVGLSEAAFKKEWEWIAPCFEPLLDDPTRLQNKRQAYELQIQKEISADNKARAKKGAEGRYGSISEDASSMLEACSDDTPSSEQAMLGDAQQQQQIQIQLSTAVDNKKPNGFFDPAASLTPGADSENKKTQEEKITKKPRKAKDTTVAEAINSAMAEIIVPLMGSTTIAAWKKSNRGAAQSLADSGQTPDSVIAAWKKISRRDGSKFLRLDWLRDEMGAENARKQMRLAGDMILANTGEVERGWVYGEPVECNGRKPNGFSRTTPQGITSDEARAWLYHGIKPAKFLETGVSA